MYGCTGTMMNNVDENGRQLFLTAYHCLEGDPAFNVLEFNYQKTQCNNASEPAPLADSVSGTILLASYIDSDYAIFEVTENIPSSYDVFLAGFNATAISYTSEFVYDISHPRIDVKKISTFRGPMYLNSFTYQTHYYPANFWTFYGWDLGMVESGSSGSALFNTNNQVIGQLWGGSSSCSYPQGINIYGALSKSWIAPEPLSAVLDPSGTGTLVLTGIRLNAIPTGTWTVTRTSTKTSPPTTVFVTSTSVVKVTSTFTEYNKKVTSIERVTSTIVQTIRSRPTVRTTYYLTTIKRTRFVNRTTTATSTLTRLTATRTTTVPQVTETTVSTVVTP